jgi:hypothetical protein
MSKSLFGGDSMIYIKKNPDTVQNVDFWESQGLFSMEVWGIGIAVSFHRCNKVDSLGLGLGTLSYMVKGILVDANWKEQT